MEKNWKGSLEKSILDFSGFFSFFREVFPKKILKKFLKMVLKFFFRNASRKNKNSELPIKYFPGLR